MQGTDLVELSATLSRKITECFPLYVKVSKVIDNHTFETTASATPVHAHDFWCDDEDHKILTAEEKARLHIQLYRSFGCNAHVLAYVQTLKQLCDSGIPLTCDGHHIVDIWVMNTTEFDVSDIPETRILKLRDPISGITISTHNTYENQEMLRAMGAGVCQRFGYGVPELSPLTDQFRKHVPKSFKSAVPHWWVAVVVEVDGIQKRSMLHIDICGAAYDDTGFWQQDGSWVSLQVFTSQVYHLSPMKSLPKASVLQDLSHKFIMNSFVITKRGSLTMRPISLLPFSVRHLRCFHRNDGSAVEVTPVSTFVQRNKRCFLGNPEIWSEVVAEIRHDIILRAPANAKVVICNLEKRPELNGRNGRVHESVFNEPPTDRIPVWVEGVENPLKVKTSCLRLTTQKQYSSFKDILTRIEKEDRNNPTTYSTRKKHLSKKDKAYIRKALAKDSETSQVLKSLETGKVTISFYADPKFVQGAKKLLSPPFDTLLPTIEIMQLRDAVEIADHPKSAEAFNILKLFKIGKQNALERNQVITHGNGMFEVAPSSDFHQLMSKIAQRIKSDQGLTELFDLMDRKGFFCNTFRRLE